MSDFSKEDELFMKELKIGDIFKSHNNYSYIYYLGIDNDRRNNKEGYGEYMFNSSSIDSEYSPDLRSTCAEYKPAVSRASKMRRIPIIYHYTKQGVCIGLCNYEKISRNILNREIIFNMIKNILLKETKLPEDVIFYIKDFM